MAERRMISKRVSLSKKLNSISDNAALAWTWAQTHTDDYGRIEGDPEVFKGTVFPIRKTSVSQVAKAIDAIVLVGLARRYQFNFNMYLEFTRFDDFQTFKADRKRRPLCPEPAETDYLESNGIQCIPGETETNPAGTLVLRELKGREVKGSKGKAWDDALGIIAFWNTLSFVKKPISLSISRYDKIKLRNLEIIKTGATWEDLIVAVGEQLFTHGKNKRKWKITFDWLIKNDTNWRKVIERAYADAKESDEPEAWGILRESLGEK